jgi:hypothetical protein
MGTIFLIIFAAICNAIMDILENENFSSSVFRNLNPKWWYKRESWKYAKKIFGWKFDGWHLFKSFMIIALMLAIVFYKPILGWMDFILFGVIWNITFSFTYKSLKIKT